MSHKQKQQTNKDFIITISKEDKKLYNIWHPLYKFHIHIILYHIDLKDSKETF